jgi:hypothetical protein
LKPPAGLGANYLVRDTSATNFCTIDLFNQPFMGAPQPQAPETVLMNLTDADFNEFDEAAEKAIDLGNRILDDDEETDDWAVASGLLAGAIQFWLFSRQPCGDSNCESCEDISTAELRLDKLLEEVRQYAEESDYYHTPNDSNVGTA